MNDKELESVAEEIINSLVYYAEQFDEYYFLIPDTEIDEMKVIVKKILQVKNNQDFPR